jgi:hypothetical protein
MRSLPALLILTFVVLGCGANTAQRPANVPPPDLDAELVNDVFFGSGTTAPATIEVRVKNNAPQPITVRRIEVQSPGMTEWGLMRQSRVFREVVEAGTTKPITFFGTAQTVTTRRNEPLSFDVIVDFESGPEPPARWQQRLHVISTRPPAR